MMNGLTTGFEINPRGTAKKKRGRSDLNPIVISLIIRDQVVHKWKQAEVADKYNISVKLAQRIYLDWKKDSNLAMALDTKIN